MKKLFFAVFCLVLSFAVDAQSANWSAIWGTSAGLYGRDQAGRTEILWSGGDVQKIIPIPQGQSAGWVMLSDQGILFSNNLRDWEKRNQGLPEMVIKLYENEKKSFVTTVQNLKALSVDPLNGEIMVSAVKNGVYLSRNGGRSWDSLGMPNFRSNGIKAVAVSSMPGVGLTVFCAHSIYGVYYINPQQRGAGWTEISSGLEKLETTNNPDEVSSFAVAVDSSGANPVVYASMSFRPRLYKLDWERKNWTLVWSGGSGFETVDSLAVAGNSLALVRNNGIAEFDLSSGAIRPRQNTTGTIKALPGYERPNCAVLSESPGQTLSLSELWLLDKSKPNYRVTLAAGKEGLYLPVNHAMDPSSLRPYLNIIKERNLNMVVIDMKDDYGRLRFTPQNPSMLNLGRIFRPVDLNVFLKTMKDLGIFTVARIVVFKDPEAAKKDGAKYAVWDSRNNKAWEGYYDTRRRKNPDAPPPNPALKTAILPADNPEFEILRTWYDENWVDPYSEVIWDYNAQVAEELCRLGFDEIQFDYIRFPTDGINLADARYRWRETGMDMDSAIVSFLRHVRSRVSSPISVDIYGANGWYRTGARTGQEVELLAPWVDIICPMYYPSHFEQDFLAHAPPEQRPYRIYYQGTRRTDVIARGRILVRPWAQAFYLNVSYDRRYYNADYVRLQAEGVRAAGNGGLTYWNNSGRYEDIPVP